MPQRIFIVVVVLVFPFCGEILAQEKIVEKFPVSSINYSNYKDFLSGQDLKTFLIKTPVKQPGKLKGSTFFIPGCRTVPFEMELFVPWSQRQPFLSSGYYVSRLTFFCQKELQIEKATSIPIRFRLGSLQYTDYLEQKPNAIR